MSDTEHSKGTAGAPLRMARYGRIAEMDRTFDIAYWQAQDASSRLRAGWEMVEFYYSLKGLPKDELRLDRSVGAYGRLSGR